jgi:pyruvate dehydrogenase E1 component
MFGFQRVGDLAWAAGDSQARGFLIGGTAGRTTLNGEGLQHEDGHSHVMANLIPNCVTYDPTYAYELTVIIQDGMRRMYEDKENKFYYITVMNENYTQPEMPIGCEEGIIKGMYLLNEVKPKAKKRVQLLGSGTILREVEAAAEILAAEFGIGADVWSATSFNELGRNAQATSRWNMLHPEATPRKSYVEECLGSRKGPVVAATDYVKAFAEQIREVVPTTYKVLGTDGYGRSDSREKLREFFEVNRYYVVVAALKALVDEGVIKPSEVSKAIKKFNIDSNKTDPVLL